jgi:hypothetical protein
LSGTTRGRELPLAAALYLLVTLAATWPLVRGLTHDLPGDYGDPLLNCWILAWDATHVGRGWWNANIFYPQPLALAYSEHLAAQALQIAPLYWLTGNAILCYNLLVLSTFVLSGLGMFLLAREFTGDAAAAIVAGLAFAFAPYRVASLPHIQVLSSAWMPITLYAFRRYFATRRRRALAAASAAWLLQNLSSGYYLLFFSPVVVMYLAWELTTRRLWNDKTTVAEIAMACAAVAAATVPFLLPYLELRRLGFNPRSLSETRRFSADVYGYATADPNIHFWGSIARAWPKAEGALFPGITVVVLAVVALARAIRAGRSNSEAAAVPLAQSVALLGILAVDIWLLLGLSIRLPGIKVTSLSRTLLISAGIAVALLAWSPRLRAAARAWLRSPAGFFAIVIVFAIVMSFGPDIRAGGRVVLGTNLYRAFYDYVPGFDGLRVPARFGLIVVFGLAALAGFALSQADRRRPDTQAQGFDRPLRRFARVLAGMLVVAESFAAPVPLNQNAADYERPGLAPLPDLDRRPPAVYSYVASLAGSTAIAELPLGEPAFDVRYMFYSTHHWRRLVNGYTGGVPREYEALDHALQDLVTRPERAWTALRAAGPTHVIVHEAFFADGRGPRVSHWLRAHGGREIAAFGTDRLFEMP